MKAAVDSYFGIDISKIDPAQAAIIAGLPKSPSNYDLVRNAQRGVHDDRRRGRPVPDDAARRPARPRPSSSAATRSSTCWQVAAGRRCRATSTRPAQFEAAKNEDVVLSSQTTQNWIAPHFVWAVRDELTNKLCGDADTCDAMQRGGLRVITTLDVGLQKIAEKWVKAAAIVPHAKNPTAAAKALGFKKLEPWMANLKNKDLRNSALVALDYQTGELVAYVGSADYYATSTKPEFQPQYDVIGKGYRQPGSAFKPFNYVTAIDDKKITAGTMLMDVGTDFGNYAPNDADNLERGPVRVRNALQFSLNIPAVKTMAINGPDRVFAKAQQFGIQFQGARTAELALALGVQEVRPVDLVTAYGTLANGGKEIPHTTILAVTDASGNEAPGVPAYVPPAGKQVVSPQAAFIVTDILAGNTNPKVNPFWGKFSVTGPGGRRPATLKTGTNNDAKDLNAYGYIAPPTDAGRAAGAYALAVGVWDGNSDNSLVSTARSPLFSIDVATYEWQGFLQEASGKWPVTDFKAPGGLVRVKIDPFTGFPAPSAKNAVNEWYIAGTEPKNPLPSDTCGIDVVAAVHVETGFGPWMQADQDWLRRAARGPGVAGGPNRTRTAYFYNGAVPSLRLELGRGGRRLVRQTKPVADVLRRADSRCERGDAVVRDTDAIRVRCGRPPLPARKPVGDAVRGALGRAVGATHGATTDRHADADREADPEAEAHADADPGDHARALDRPEPFVTEEVLETASDDGRPVGRRGPRAHRASWRTDHPRPARPHHPGRRTLGGARAERLRQDHPAVVHRVSSCGRPRGPSMSSASGTAGSIRASCAGGSGRPGARSRAGCAPT